MSYQTDAYTLATALKEALRELASDPAILQAIEQNLQAYDSLTSELQIKSSGDGPLKWVLGAFYLQEKNNIRFDVELNPGSVNFPLVGYNVTEVRVYRLRYGTSVSVEQVASAMPMAMRSSVVSLSPSSMVPLPVWRPAGSAARVGMMP